MVVLPMDHGETVGDRFEAGRLGSLVKVGADVRAMHDLGQPVERRVVETVFQDDRLEAAAGVDGPELTPSDVMGDRAFPCGLGGHLSRRYVEKLGLGVDEALHQPWTRDPIHAGILSGYPLHPSTLLSLKYRHLGYSRPDGRGDVSERPSRPAPVQPGPPDAPAARPRLGPAPGRGVERIRHRFGRVGPRFSTVASR